MINIVSVFYPYKVYQGLSYNTLFEQFIQILKSSSTVEQKRIGDFVLGLFHPNFIRILVDILFL